MKKDVETWGDWLLKGLIVGISTFAVAHLKEIGTQTAALSSQFLELKYEIKRLAENQIQMNSEFAKRLEKIEARVETIEHRKGKRND
ncbi:MAG: hypothetical protein ACO3FL_04465 [Ilumatobacteraceae bacterium]